MAEEGSGLAELAVGGPIELKAVPGFGFLPNDVVEMTNQIFQVRSMMKRSVKYMPSHFWIVSCKKLPNISKNVHTNMRRRRAK